MLGRIKLRGLAFGERRWTRLPLELTCVVWLGTEESDFRTFRHGCKEQAMICDRLQPYQAQLELETVLHSSAWRQEMIRPDNFWETGSRDARSPQAVNTNAQAKALGVAIDVARLPRRIGGAVASRLSALNAFELRKLVREMVTPLSLSLSPRALTRLPWSLTLTLYSCQMQPIVLRC